MNQPHTQRWRVSAATLEDVPALEAMYLRLLDHVMQENQELLPMSSQGRASLATRYQTAITEAKAQVLVARPVAVAAPAAQEPAAPRGFPLPVPIGMAVGRIVVQADLEPAHMGRIDDVWVEPDYRRQGICRALVSELLRFLQNRMCRFWCWTMW